MNHLARHSYLGLALEEALEELGQSDLREDMQAILTSVFTRNLKEVMSKVDGKPVEIKATEEGIREAPFGDRSQDTSLLVVCNDLHYSGGVEFLNARGQCPTCIEAFSDNREKTSGKFHLGNGEGQ